MNLGAQVEEACSKHGIFKTVEFARHTALCRATLSIVAELIAIRRNCETKLSHSRDRISEEAE